MNQQKLADVVAKVASQVFSSKELIPTPGATFIQTNKQACILGAYAYKKLGNKDDLMLNLEELGFNVFTINGLSDGFDGLCEFSYGCISIDDNEKELIDDYLYAYELGKKVRLEFVK